MCPFQNLCELLAGNDGFTAKRQTLVVLWDDGTSYKDVIGNVESVM